MVDFSRCLEYDPYHVESRIARAQLYRELGDDASATADLEMAERLDPEHPELARLAQTVQEVSETPTDETTLRER